jgi:hypothetical protein
LADALQALPDQNEGRAKKLSQKAKVDLPKVRSGEDADTKVWRRKKDRRHSRTMMMKT